MIDTVNDSLLASARKKYIDKQLSMQYPAKTTGISVNGNETVEDFFDLSPPTNKESLVKIISAPV